MIPLAVVSGWHCLSRYLLRLDFLVQDPDPAHPALTAGTRELKCT